MANQTDSKKSKKAGQIENKLMVVQIFSILLVAVSLFLQYNANVDQNRWEKGRYAYELFKDFSKMIGDLRKGLYRYFPEMVEPLDDYEPYSVESFKKLYLSKKGETILLETTNKKDKYRCISVESELRNKIIKVYNFFECISHSYYSGLIDKKVFKETYTSLILRWEEIFGNFRKAVMDVTMKDPWKPFTRLIEE